jgi:uncharacterized protein with HEPN domain
MKDDALYFGHMLDSARKAYSKISGINRAAYDADETLKLALAHLIQIIGEAAQHVSKESYAAHPEIPWHEITGMRHKIVHDYMGVNYNIIWQVVTQDLPILIAALEKIVPTEEG